MSTPKISILVPIFNVEKYLNECIDSIINQTLKDIEILLLDDGSTDSSKDICDEYSKLDSRIRVIHKSNSGYGATMNVGIKEARGEFIGIVESDDKVEFDMFEDLYSCVQKNINLDIVKSCRHFRYINGKSEICNPNIQQPTLNKIVNVRTNPEIFNINGSYIWTSIYNRKFLLDNNLFLHESPGACYQDTSFEIITTLYANKIYIIDKPHYHYRLDNPSSSFKSSSKQLKLFDEYKYCYSKLKQNMLTPNIQQMLNYKEFNAYHWGLRVLNNDCKPECIIKIIERYKKSTLRDLKYFDKNSLIVLFQILNCI